MTPDATRLAAAIRGWALDCGALVTRFVRRDDWSDALAEHLVVQGVRWPRPVEDVELPEVSE